MPNHACGSNTLNEFFKGPSQVLQGTFTWMLEEIELRSCRSMAGLTNFGQRRVVWLREDSSDNAEGWVWPITRLMLHWLIECGPTQAQEPRENNNQVKKILIGYDIMLNQFKNMELCIIY